jgi:hypothetical protein
MKSKHPPRARLRVAFIPEKRLHPGRLIHERQFVCTNMGDIIRQPGRVTPRLFRHPRERRPDLLRLHHPHGIAVHEQHIIREPALHRELPHCHALGGVQVHPGAVLYRPAGGGEELVDLLAGEGFRGRHWAVLPTMMDTILYNETAPEAHA